jgi:hypothetical protein
MKRTISTLAVLGTLILPANAGETPSKADMLKGLIVVGVYSRICGTTLSEAAKARTLTILKMMDDLDSNLLDFAITAYARSFTPDDIGPWCRETGEALREGSKLGLRRCCEAA